MTSQDKTSTEVSDHIERLRNPYYASMVSDLSVIESDRMWAELDAS